MNRLRAMLESPHALPVSAIVLLHVLLFRGVFWGASVVQSGDIAAAFYPWQRYAGHALSSGYIPEWFPYSFCGYPFIANIQVHLFHPTFLLSWLWDPIVALSFSMALHMILASLGAYAYFTYLTRREGHGTPPVDRRWAALFGALLFCPAGFFLFRASVGHTTVIYSLAPLPWVCLAVEHLFDGTRRWSVPAIALLLSLSLLGGHPQFTLYTLMVVGWIVLYRFPRDAAARRAWLAAVGWLAVAGALFALIICVQLLPTLQLIHYMGDRDPHSVYQYAVKDSVTVLTLLTLFHPNAVGTAALNWSTHSGWHEINLFVGVSGLMAALCLLPVLSRKRRWWIATTLLVLLILAMGSQTPVYPFLYRHFAPIRFFRGAARIQCLVQFFLAMAAALGLARLLAEPKRHTSRVLTAVTVFAGIWILLLLLLAFFPESSRILMARLVNRTYRLHFSPVDLPFPDGLLDMASVMSNGGQRLLGAYHELFFRLLGFLPLALLAGTLLYVLARGRRVVLPVLVAMLTLETALLFIPSVHLHNRVDYMAENFPRASTVRFLQSQAQKHIGPVRFLGNESMYWYGARDELQPFFPNRLTVFGLYDVRGYDRLVLARYTHYWNRMLGRAPDAYLGMVMKLPDLAQVRAGMLARLNAGYLLSTDPVSGTAYTPVFDQRIKEMHVVTYQHAGNLGPAYLCRESCLAASAEGETDLLPGRLLAWNEKNPQDFTVRCDASEDGVLVLSTITYPGWHAWIDGKPADVGIAYQAFLAVRVPTGTHDVRLAFRSKPLRVGAGLSLLGLLATLGVSIYLFRRERPRCT